MNLFKGIPNRRAVLSWGTFDLANQSFTLVINTLLFGIFVKIVVMDGDDAGDFAWALMGALSLGAVAVFGPVLGALADARACKKKFLIGTGVLCALLTACLCFLPSGAAVGVPFALTLAFLLYVPANIAFNVGENFLASFLPEIASRQTMGRISAIGWTMGYAGALILLAGFAVATKVLDLRGPEEDPDQYRPFLFIAGLWFAIMIVPTLLFLPERRLEEQAHRSTQPVRDAFRQMGRTIREASRFRDLACLLGSFLVYGMGVQVIIFFAGVIAREDFGFSTTQLFLFAIVVTLTAGAAAFLTGMMQDRIGHKATLLSFLALWTGVGGGLLLLSILHARVPDFPPWPVWVVGAALGLGVGGIGTGTRAAVGVLTPAHRTAEFFGLWGTTYKAAGVIGLLVFGWVRSIWDSAPSLAVLTAFFVVGGLLVWWLVDMDRGSRNAQEVEEELVANLAGAKREAEDQTPP